MKKKLIFLSLFFLLLIVMMAPAKLVQNLIPNNIPVEFENINGTIWFGNISKAVVNDWNFETVDYQLSFISLLVATASGNMSIEKGDAWGELSFSISDQNNLSITQANVKVMAEKMVSFIPFPGIELSGALSSENFDVKIEDKKIVSLSGLTSWKNAVVTVKQQRWELGDFSVDWSTNESDQSMVGRLKKTKNLMDLQGNITLNSAGVLEFKGSISSSTDRNIYTALTLFADGKAELGRLPIKFKKKIQ
jgi:hypothetical protein